MRRLIIVDRESDRSRDPTECAKLFVSYDTAVVDRDWVIESVAAYRVRGVAPFLAHEATKQELEGIAGIGGELLPEEPSMAIA